MATLVTGGTGFVASNIVRELARSGHQVVCLDLNAADRIVEDFVKEVSSNITFVQGNILDKEVLARLGDEHPINKIVHAAVYTANRRDLETQRSREIVDINVEGTANLLDLARTLDVDRFVYVSSGSAYGTASLADRTLNEDTPVAPHTLYSITKYASELLTQRYGELHEFSTASVRLSTPTDPWSESPGTGRSCRYSMTGPGRPSGERIFGRITWTWAATTPTCQTSPTGFAQCWTHRLCATISTISRRGSG